MAAAPVTSTHRNLQTNAPFYPSLSNAALINTDYLVRTPITIPTPSPVTDPVIGIKVLDRSFNRTPSPIVITSNNRLAVTTDGVNWIPVPSPDNVEVFAVLNVPGTSQFVLETENGILYTSPDGLTWTLVNMTQSDDGFFNLLSFAGDYLWATSYSTIVDPDPANNWNSLYGSNDGGITWTLFYDLNGFADPKGFRGIVYGYNLGVPV